MHSFNSFPVGLCLFVFGILALIAYSEIASAQVGCQPGQQGYTFPLTLSCDGCDLKCRSFLVCGSQPYTKFCKGTPGLLIDACLCCCGAATPVPIPPPPPAPSPPPPPSTPPPPPPSPTPPPPSPTPPPPSPPPPPPSPPPPPPPRDPRDICDADETSFSSNPPSGSCSPYTCPPCVCPGGATPTDESCGDNYCSCCCA